MILKNHFETAPLAYYLDVKQNKTQVEYTAYGTGYQVCLPMDYDFEKSF